MYNRLRIGFSIATHIKFQAKGESKFKIYDTLKKTKAIRCLYCFEWEVEMTQNSYSVGVYCRLSKDDKDYYKESASISNQKRLLMEHVAEYGWNVWETYVDDGFSGTNFDRPNFRRMIQEVEKGRINCVVVKDLSRFGRNHVDVGRYMQDYFPEMGVRFIAIHDSYDDGDENFDSYNDFAPFKNLMNEFYPKDVSRKVRAVKKSGAKQGLFMNSKAAYGYVKSEADKHILVVDDEAANVVKRIFTLFLKGYSGRYIADILNGEGILSPRAYHYNRIGKPNPYDTKDKWGSGSIMSMLRNPVYIGNMVQCRRSTISFKNKKVKALPKDKWIIFENTHEAIIEKELFDEVQKIILSNRKIKTASIKQEGLFSGLIRCADCGNALGFSVKKQARGDKFTYRCTRYINKGKNACSPHYIEEPKVAEIILNDIRQYAILAQNDKEKLIKKLLKSNSLGNARELADNKKKLHEANRRMEKITSSLKGVFEEKLAGNLSENLFKTLSSQYEKDYAELEIQIQMLNKSITALENSQDDTERWVRLIEQYINIEKLDRETVFELVESIEVGQAEKINGISHQDIKVKYKFIGAINSEDEVSEELQNNSLAI